MRTLIPVSSDISLTGLTVSIKYHPRIAKVLLDNKKVKEIENYYKKCADDGATYEDIEASKKAMSSMEIILGDIKKGVYWCSMDDKIQLWAKALPNLTEETCKKHFDELGFPELKGIFTKRNNYTKTYEDNSFIRDILYVLKKNTWIFDYYKKSDDEGYVVVKNPIKDKRY